MTTAVRAARTTCLLLAASLAIAAGASGATGSPHYEPDRPAIINGTMVTPADYVARWSAMAGVVATSSAGMALCGGVVIDERTVLTAAHCTYGPSGGALAAANVDVVVGRRVASTTDGDRVPVLSITRHPSFSRSTMRNDIAVLRLSRTPTVAITPIQPTSLADESWWGAGAGRATGGAAVGPWIAGWGAVNGSGTSFPAELREAAVPIASDAACAAATAPGHGANFDAATMLCAGVPGATAGAGVDACQGDSGGPLIVGDGVGGWRVIGLTSWGRDCGGPYYGVYTRVGRYASWIEPLRYQASTSPPTDTSPPAQPAPAPPEPADPPNPSGPGPTPPAAGGPSPQPAAPGTGAGTGTGAGAGGDASTPPLPAGSAVGPLTLPAVAEANQPPTRPTLFRVVARGRGWVTLGWRRSIDDAPGVRYRVLVRSGVGGGWRVWRTISKTRLTLRLERGATTSLRVQALDAAGRRSTMSGVLRARPA